MAAPAANQAIVSKVEPSTGTPAWLKANGSGGFVYDTVSANATLFSDIETARRVCEAYGGSYGCASFALASQNWTAR